MNNKELQMTTTMPTMKKSLLALAVAGTMAMSGGVYAESTIAMTAGAAYTDVSGTNSTITTLAGSDTVTVTGTGTSVTGATTTSGTTTDVEITDTHTATTIQVLDGAATHDGVDIGAISMETGDTITISSIDTTANVELTIGAVTTSSGTDEGTLTITGTDATGTTDISVTATDIGTGTADLLAINVTGTVTEAASLTITGDAFAVMTTVTGIANAAATLTVAGATASVTGNIDLDGAAVATDAVLVLGTTTASSTATVSGIIDLKADGDFGTVTIAGDTTVTGGILSSGATAMVVNFSEDKTLTIGAHSVITDAVTTTTDGEGSLVFTAATADGDYSVASNIGTSSAKLKAVTINVNDADATNDVISTISGDIFATTVTANAVDAWNGTHGGKIVLAKTVNATDLEIAGAGHVDLDGDVTADVNFGASAGATGTVTVAANKKIDGAVTTATAKTVAESGQEGTLTFAATTADTTLASSTIGTAANALLALNVTVTDGDNGGGDESTTATISGNVFSKTITATATGAYTNATTDGDVIAFGGDVTAGTLNIAGLGKVTVAGDVTSNVVFANSTNTTGELEIAADKIITGAVTSGADHEGILTFLTAASNKTLVSGVVGAASGIDLYAMNVATGAGFTSTFADAVDVKTITISGAGTVEFNGAVGAGASDTTTVNITEGATVQADASIDGTVTTDVTNTGNLTLASGIDVSGIVGGAKVLKTVTTSTSAMGAAVSATNINLAGTGTSTFAGDVTGAVNFTADGTATVAEDMKIVGAVTTATTNTGTLTFATTVSDTTLASSTIGTSSKLIEAVNVTVTDGGSDNATATLAGDIFATTVTATATSGSSGVDTVAFGDKVTATTLNLDGAGVFTFADTVNAAVVISGDSTATVAADTGIVGAVTNDGTSGKGTLTFTATTANTTLASSTIGATGKLLSAVNVTSTANTATLAGNVFATTVTATATDTTGSDRVAFGGTVNGATLTLTGSGTFAFDDIVTLTTDLDLDAGAKIVLTDGIVSGDTVFAVATDSDTSAIATSAVVTMPETLNSGSINFIDYAVSASGAADALLIDVNPTTLATFDATVGSDATIVKITATKKSAATIASELNITTNQASALDNAVTALATGDATGLSAMQTALTTGITESNVEQMQPDASAAKGAAMAVTGGVNNVIAGRQANTRVAFNTLGKQSGVSTGDAANDAVVWAQVFTSNATQDRVGAIDGYDADNQGFVVGWEATGKSGSTLGLSLSYSDTDVDGKSAAASHTDTTATQASLYGNNGSIDWMMGYASADNDTKRTINFGGLNRTATGNYGSDIIMAKAGNSFDSIEAGGFTLTPKADLSWTHISNAGYTETGANDLNLIVGSSSNDVVTARAGAEFAQRIENNGSVTIPRVSVMAGYDLVNDRAETTSTFTGGGSAFTTQGIDPEKASLALGFGVDHVSDDSTASFDFNADIKDGYSNNTASLTFKSKF